MRVAGPTPSSSIVHILTGVPVEVGFCALTWPSTNRKLAVPRCPLKA